MQHTPHLPGPPSATVAPGTPAAHPKPRVDARVAARRQRIVGTRRSYNQWVNDETLEDYALRFTARRARIWSPAWVGGTALGSIAFLACEAIGATVTINYGVASTLWALAAAALVFLAAGLPVCFYAARYGVDMDLLTRGSGFGYLGSTITSAVYASFTFILFAIEAVILSAALNLCLGLPLPIAHVISALVVIPIAAYGFRRISAWQNWTQPLWLLMQLAPLLYVGIAGRGAIEQWHAFGGENGGTALSFAPALAVFLSLLPQIGEQADYLRFLPDESRIGRARWWTALLATGPGWIVIGGLKIAIGSFLAVMALNAGMARGDATNATMLYYLVYSRLTTSPTLAIALTGLFVALCQVKINVTNAYAGSIASSNFFSRLTHRHPGRAIWLIFNTIIALMLMESGIQTVVERVLALYSNFAVAWFGAVVADLVVNKPLGLSPRGIEFRRAYLHDVNPVGVGAMVGSLLGSSLCFFGWFGPVARSFAPLVGLALAFVLSPLIALATRGRYYMARAPHEFEGEACDCKVCQNRFETPDMALCPVYEGPICSLCCTLEARCHDACKERPQALDRVAEALTQALPATLAPSVYARIVRFVLGYTLILAILAVVLVAIDIQQVAENRVVTVSGLLGSVFVGLAAVSAFGVWYLVLNHESQRAAEEESERQSAMLLDEIEAHARTDAELQRAKNAAEAANLAKSRYIIGISHEIRTPLNAISGYAQLLERNPSLPVADAVRVIRRSATHLGDLVDGLVDVSRIENGSVRLARVRVNLPDLLEQIAAISRIQATTRGISFDYTRPRNLPEWVFADAQRLRQILINLTSNAIKYTPSGGATLHVRWRDPVAELSVSDTGVGIPAEHLERIFEPFERLGTVRGQPGVGLGLTITRLLVEVMGGQLTVTSEPGSGSTFRVKMAFFETSPPEAGHAPALSALRRAGPAPRILVVDDDPAHIDLLRDLLHPGGFELEFAISGEGGIEACRRQLPDLVIMDVAMPGIDGWTAARRLREAYGEELAILMVSANVHDFQRQRRPDDPHDDYLVKPYDLDQLVEKLALLLELGPSSGIREGTPP